MYDIIYCKIIKNIYLIKNQILKLKILLLYIIWKSFCWFCQNLTGDSNMNFKILEESLSITVHYSSVFHWDVKIADKVRDYCNVTQLGPDDRVRNSLWRIYQMSALLWFIINDHQTWNVLGTRRFFGIISRQYFACYNVA